MPSRTSILETLPKVVSSPPKLKSKSTSSSIEKLFFEIQRTFHNHPYLGFASLLAALVTFSVWGRGRIRRGRGPGGLMNGSGQGVGFFKLDGKEGLLGSAGHGGNQNGKVD